MRRGSDPALSRISGHGFPPVRELTAACEENVLAARIAWAYRRAPAETRSPLEARPHLKQALDIMQQNALHADKIDWTKLRNEAFQRSREPKQAFSPSTTIRRGVPPTLVWKVLVGCSRGTRSFDLEEGTAVKLATIQVAVNLSTWKQRFGHLCSPTAHRLCLEKP